MAQKTINDQWLTEHKKILTEISEHIKDYPEDDIKIIQGDFYTSLLTPDADGLYFTPLMQAIGKLRDHLKNEINVQLPTIRLIGNQHNSDGIVADNEIAISVNKKVIWKVEVDAQNIEACDTAVINELNKIMECRK